MSKKTIDIPEVSNVQTDWSALLEELNAEIQTSENLTDEEKRLLEEMDKLSDEEWEPITCKGKPISETIIEDRGEH